MKKYSNNFPQKNYIFSSNKPERSLGDSSLEGEKDSFGKYDELEEYGNENIITETDYNNKNEVIIPIIHQPLIIKEFFLKMKKDTNYYPINKNKNNILNYNLNEENNFSIKKNFNNENENNRYEEANKKNNSLGNIKLQDREKNKDKKNDCELNRYSFKYHGTKKIPNNNFSSLHYNSSNSSKNRKNIIIFNNSKVCKIKKNQESNRSDAKQLAINNSNFKKKLNNIKIMNIKSFKNENHQIKNFSFFNKENIGINSHNTEALNLMEEEKENISINLNGKFFEKNSEEKVIENQHLMNNDFINNKRKLLRHPWNVTKKYNIFSKFLSIGIDTSILSSIKDDAESLFLEPKITFNYPFNYNENELDL